MSRNFGLTRREVIQPSVMQMFPNLFNLFVGLKAWKNGSLPIGMMDIPAGATIPEACPCRGEAWNAALAKATHDGPGSLH